MECQRPQIYEFDLRRYAVPVRDGKGATDWSTMLGEPLKAPPQDWLKKANPVRRSS